MWRPRFRRGFLAPVLTLLVAASLGAWPAAGARRAAQGSPKPRVIFVGWDGADWALLDALLRQGKLPNLAAVVGNGRTWDLASFQPMSSPLIWTTMATGRSPLDHGVGDFLEVDPKTRRHVPISGRSRKVPAVWNVATARGVRVGVVGWWATWPAEKVDGFLVSDRAAPLLFDPGSMTTSDALAWPEGLAEGVRLVSRREERLGFEEIATALRVTRAEYDKALRAGRGLEDPITGYRRILVSTRIHARIALDLYERERPELLMVYFQGTDEIGHVAGQFAPPKLPSIPEGDFRRFSGAVEAIYVEHDRILGRLREKALRDGATLLLASDHGFRLGDDRPVSAGPGVGFDTAFLWHRDPGMMAAEGPGVVPARERGKASVFDVAPTLCRLLGLPPDPAFEGRPASGLGGPGLPEPVPAISWEKSVRVERLVPRERQGGEDKEAEEFTRKLIALGYLTGPRAAAVDARSSDRTGTETAAHQQNLATFLRARGRAAESLPYYEKALEIDPGSAGTWMNYSLALLQAGRWRDADDALVRALVSGLPDGERAAFRRVSTWVERISKRHAERKELIRYLEALGAAFPSNDRYRASLGATLLEDGRCADSTALLAAIVSRQPRNVEVLNLMAVSSECLGRIPEAREWFERSLAVKPDQPEVREAMARMSKGRVPPK